MKFGGAAGLAGFLAYKAIAPTTLGPEDEAARQKAHPGGLLSQSDADKAKQKQLDEEKRKQAERPELFKPPAGLQSWPKLLRDRPIWEGEHPIKGSAADIRGLLAGSAANPAAGIRGEESVAKGAFKGTMEGSRQGILDAFRELRDARNRAGGGIQRAAYHPEKTGGAPGAPAAPSGGLPGSSGSACTSAFASPRRAARDLGQPSP